MDVASSASLTPAVRHDGGPVHEPGLREPGLREALVDADAVMLRAAADDMRDEPQPSWPAVRQQVLRRVRTAARRSVPIRAAYPAVPHPEAAVPEATVPEATVPEATVPEVARREVAARDLAERGVAGHGAAERDVLQVSDTVLITLLRAALDEVADCEPVGIRLELDGDQFARSVIEIVVRYGADLRSVSGTAREVATAVIVDTLGDDALPPGGAVVDIAVVDVIVPDTGS